MTVQRQPSRCGGRPDNSSTAGVEILSFTVFLALLGAAALHAGWNALVRHDPDRDAAAMAIAVGGAVLGVVLLPFLPPIAVAAAPYILASSILQTVYYILVGRAYRHGELSLIYPVMRGLAPVIVTIAAAIIIAEPTSLGVVAGVVLVALGMAALSIDGLRSAGAAARSGLAAAAGNACVIAAYTLVDGLGARASEAPAAYTAWLCLGSGIGTVVWRMAVGGRLALSPVAARVGVGLAGAAMAFVAYAIALWAMTRAPIGAVAAVRESSVLFATVIGAVALHERFGVSRWVAAALVAAGLVLVKLSAA